MWHHWAVWGKMKVWHPQASLWLQWLWSRYSLLLCKHCAAIASKTFRLDVVHSPSGCPFGISSKDRRTKDMTQKRTSSIKITNVSWCNLHNHRKRICVSAAHWPILLIPFNTNRVVFVSDSWPLMLRHHVVLTHYTGGPYDTPFVWPLPCLDLWT